MKTTDRKEQQRKVYCRHCLQEVEWQPVRTQHGNINGEGWRVRKEWRRFDLDGKRHRCTPQGPSEGGVPHTFPKPPTGKTGA